MSAAGDVEVRVKKPLALQGSPRQDLGGGIDAVVGDGGVDLPRVGWGTLF